MAGAWESGNERMEKSGAHDRSSREEWSLWQELERAATSVWRRVELMAGARENGNECMGKSGACDRSSRVTDKRRHW
jgi:hypothetical protein